MNNRSSWTSKFYIYPKDVSKFIEFCERFQCIKDTEIEFVLEEEQIEEDSFIWEPRFIASVTHFSELDSLKFINVFSLFFRDSKYCSMM